jgi:hypothetical protein
MKATCLNFSIPAIGSFAIRLATGEMTLERGTHAIECGHIVRPLGLGSIGADEADNLATIGVRRNAHPVAPIHDRVVRSQTLDDRLKIGAA